MFFAQSTPNGIDLINSTLSQFEHTQQQLQTGINHCEAIIETNNNKIGELEAENEVNRDTIAKADRVINKIKELLS